MFTFILQLIDLAKLHQVGPFLGFFIFSWVIYLIKIAVMVKRNPLHLVDLSHEFNGTVSIIIPIVDEPVEVWRSTLDHLKVAIKHINLSEVIVVANGHNGIENINIAREMGFEVIRLPDAGKRMAIKAGAKRARGQVTIILDSDTQVTENSIKILTSVFADPTVGGATPHHIISNKNSNLYRRVSNWLEDIRFEEVVKGQSSYGSVSCLPGRMLAITTSCLNEIIPGLVSQRFLKSDCISGDDRYITSELLRGGMRTVYVPDSVVFTEAPDTLKGFVLQRLRWSRTSFRETFRSLSWTWRYWFMTLTVLSTVIMRWVFFYVTVTALMAWAGFIERTHAVNLPLWLIVVGTVAGFFASGVLRQLRHLLKHPEDFKYLPAFLVITTFILTPVEWIGNLTVRESNWMTRKTT